MLAFLRDVAFPGEKIKRAPELIPPRRPGISPDFPPTKTGGGWVLAVLSSGSFFVVARDAKKMKGEIQKQAEKSEKRERNARRGRETQNT